MSSSSTSSSSSGYCSDTMSASGFKNAEYDGTYVKTGEFQGKPYWVNENGKYIYWYMYADWVAGDALGVPPLYVAPHDSVCPYNVTCAQWRYGGGIVCSV